MAEKSVAEKLMIKDGRRVLFVNPPAGYDTLLGELPPQVTVMPQPNQPVDIIQVFVANRQELEEQLSKLKPLVKPKGMLWVTYYKGTSKTKTDIHRDTIVAYARTLGMDGVAMVAIDDDWSALRLKVV